MVLTLYFFKASPPSRFALLTARAIGVPVEIKVVNTLKKEQLTPEYLKINPQHLIPTLQDGDFILWESNAIAGYLVGRYAKDDTLYPKDVKKRAIVDHRLNFASTALFPSLGAMLGPVVFDGAKSFSEASLSQVKEALAILEKFLEDGQWVAGDTLTIADLACVTNVSSLVAVGFDVSPYKNVKRWLANCESQIVGYDEINKDGATELAKVVANSMAKA